VVADKGYHSGAALLSLRQVGVRSYIPELERGRDNILKRLLIQAVGFNLALLVRERHGIGKPRTPRGLCVRLWCVQIVFFAPGMAEWAVQDRSDTAAA
jgi:hypothetical protein